MSPKSIKSIVTLTTVLLVTILTGACQRQLDPEQPCGFVQSSELQRVSWKENFPVRFMIHNSVPDDAYDAIRAAKDHWNERFGREIFKIEIYGIGGVNRPKQDNVNVIYWMENWEQDRSTEQARTTIYWTGSRIYEADIRVNANFQFHKFDLFSDEGERKPISGVDLESLLVHEFGHVIGLAHREESNSVMQTTLATGVDRRKLSQNDLDSVKCEYDAHEH